MFFQCSTIKILTIYIHMFDLPKYRNKCPPTGYWQVYIVHLKEQVIETFFLFPDLLSLSLAFHYELLKQVFERAKKIESHERESPNKSDFWQNHVNKSFTAIFGLFFGASFYSPQKPAKVVLHQHITSNYHVIMEPLLWQ